MYRVLFFFGLTVLIITNSITQPKYNLDFEQLPPGQMLPNAWFPWGTYTLRTDSTVVHSGQYAANITANGQGNFGSIAYRLPANYEGDSITLEGYMKLDSVADGFAGLLLRVDADRKPLVFDNMQQRKLQGTMDWQQYRTTLPFPQEAEDIYVAGILVGKGQAWFDDFKVLIDGEDIQTLPEVAKELPPARLDTTFDEGSEIVLNELTAEVIHNLYAVGKVWGFAKYHHPAIASGDYHWDYELLRILPAVQDASFMTRMTEWLPPVTKGEDDQLPGDTLQRIKLSSPTDWLSQAPWLSQEARQQLQAIQDAPVGPSHYYLDFVPNVGNPIFQHEHPYPHMEWTDDGFKLLGLFRYWNMIEYFFPYRHLMDENWDEVLREFIPKMTAADDELSYKLTLLELITKVQDTHANIWQDSVISQFYGPRAIPIQVNMVEDQAVVVKVFESLNANSTVSVGDVITHIDGKEVSQRVQEHQVYAPASNRPTQLRDIARRLLRTDKNLLSITFQNEHGTFQEEIPTVDLTKEPLNYWSQQVSSHQTIKNDIGYIYPGSLKEGEIDTIMNEFMDKKGLIVDLRCYPSEFIVFSLGKYLMPSPTPFAKFTVGSLRTPGQFVFRDSPLQVGKENPNYFSGKVVILINELTQSQAEYTTMALRVAPRATVIGSTTAGADGNVSSISLPGGIETMSSGIGIYYPDGTEAQRIGIVPDVEMHPTIEGIRAGKDELLDKAIEMINP